MKILDLVGKGLTPYFKLTVPAAVTSQAAPPAIPLISNDDIISKVYSFKVEEKEGQPAMVNLSVIDDTGRLNKKYSYGVKIEAEWGLKQNSSSFVTRYTSPKSKSLDEITGQYRRGPVLCHLSNYSVSGSDGIAVATLTMRMGLQAGYSAKTRNFVGNTPRLVITQLAAELGFFPVIKFDGADTLLTPRSTLRQSNETSFAFLRKLAFKYNCKMVVQSDPSILYFVSWDRNREIDYADARGLSGQVHVLDYGSQESTIISFSIDMQSGSNSGSTISIVTGADGQSHASFSPSSTESTEIWELDPDKIKAALKSKSIKDQAALVAEIQSAGFQDLDRLKKLYFTKRVATTAPEGNGYTAKAKIIPNPDMQVGDMVFLGSKASLIPPQFKSRYKKESVFANGIPIVFGEADPKTLWRITSITQTIDGSNYSFEIEMAR